MLSDDELEHLLVSQTAGCYRLATWILTDACSAEDAVQQAALAAWNGRDRMRRADNPAAWFTQVVVNVCRDELRERQRHRKSRPAHVLVEADPPDRQLSIRDEVGRAISRLTGDEQLVVGLRFGRDLTIRQIADLTGLAEGTVKSRLHHSLEHLRAALAAERRIEEQVP